MCPRGMSAEPLPVGGQCPQTIRAVVPFETKMRASRTVSRIKPKGRDLLTARAPATAGKPRMGAMGNLVACAAAVVLVRP